MNLLEMMCASARRFGQRECLRSKRDGHWLSWTYQEVWELSLRLAVGLHKLGTRRNDKVGLLANNRPEWPISDLAILRLCAIVTPIYPTLPSHQVRFILENAEVRWLIVDNYQQVSKLENNWPPQLQRVIVMDGPLETTDERVLSWDEVLHLGNAPVPDAIPEIGQIPNEQIATIVHTSGTSGQPKGVMLSHGNLVSNVLSSLTVISVTGNDVGLSYLPLSHIFERTVGQFVFLASGCTIVYAEGVDKIQENLLEVRPTVLITVPRLLEKAYTRFQEQLELAPKAIRCMVQHVLRRGKTDGATYRLVDRLVFRKMRAALGGRLRLIVSGGAALNPEIASFYMQAGIPVCEGYGMTESSPVVSVNSIEAPRPGTVGRPIPGVQVKLGDDGELLVKGANVMKGYYRLPEETQKAVDAEGWLHTGDIAEIDADGYIRIIDRKKNILVLATGKNVAPLPIESALCLAPHIGNAVLIGDKRKYVSALIVPDFASMSSFLQQKGISGPATEWIHHPEVIALFRKEVYEAVQPFAGFEQPKRFVLLPEEFTIESGHLTPTLKVRNQIIAERYRDQIEAMYNGRNFIPVFEDLPDRLDAADSSRPTSQSLGQ
ncbi:MAG: long-chain fatty acid--CoA ligase [Alicyclobacillus herbarius]|uniref:AMP-dependent synthetase/ligase n=1 Tax=Alicyclobacillus herbarius TaxID=122960 RepID=UPI0023540B0D|nr:long-chain fatty acid--CoA ligase [Alicyclobacillus herbarius]MCL6632957.1 long-chain fatty acid--CoA ligase [Alicyclobacillus herbarius]